MGFCSEAENARILPWMLELPTNNSATVCMEQCAAFGYPAAGVEVSLLFILRYILLTTQSIVWHSMLYVIILGYGPR